MNAEQTRQLLTSLAALGASIAAAAAPASAATFALAAIVREAPHLVDIASIILATGKLTEEQMTEAHTRAIALATPENIPPAA
jgi:hypothetical protein